MSLNKLVEETMMNMKMKSVTIKRMSKTVFFKY